jgi:hypothetical protein
MGNQVVRGFVALQQGFVATQHQGVTRFFCAAAFCVAPQHDARIVPGFGDPESLSYLNIRAV